MIIGNVPHWEPTLPIYAVRNKVILDRELLLFMSSYKSLSLNDVKLKDIADKHGVRFLSALSNSCSDNKCFAVVAYKEGFQLSAWDNMGT